MGKQSLEQDICFDCKIRNDHKVSGIRMGNQELEKVNICIQTLARYEKKRKKFPFPFNFSIHLISLLAKLNDIRSLVKAYRCKENQILKCKVQHI